MTMVTDCPVFLGFLVIGLPGGIRYNNNVAKHAQILLIKGRKGLIRPETDHRHPGFRAISEELLHRAQVLVAVKRSIYLNHSGLRMLLQE